MGESRREQQQRFEALVRAHSGIVFKVARIYARGDEDRHDLAQDIYIQLWRAFSSYDSSRRFSTWMYRIALNVGISYLRHASRGMQEPLLEEHLSRFESAEPDERLQQLHEFIGALDEFSRALILLYLEERSYAQIAEILGISQTNVATKLGRIKQRLRGQLLAASAYTHEDISHGA